jgi:hypothetical protein
VRKIGVLAQDGRELNLSELMWIDRDGDPVPAPAAIKTAAE